MIRPPRSTRCFFGSFLCLARKKSSDDIALKPSDFDDTIMKSLFGRIDKTELLFLLWRLLETGEDDYWGWEIFSRVSEKFIYAMKF